MAAVIFVSVRVGVQSPHRQSVYPVFYEAAQKWWQGEDLYLKSALGFRYSPIVAAGLVPVSWLPEKLGGILWRWINVTALVWGLLWCCRRGLPRHCDAGLAAIIFLLVFPDALANINNGQPNALVVGLLLASVAAVMDKRWNLAAACLAVSALFKVYPVALGMLLVLLYPKQLGWRLALALGIGLLLPFVLQRPEYVRGQYRDWFAYVWQENRQVVPVREWYRDVRLIAKVWLGLDMSDRAYKLIEILVAAWMAGICWVGQRRGWGMDRLLVAAFVMGCGWMTVLGPATETVTYLILAPAATWVVVLTFANHRPFWERGLVVLAYLLMLSVHIAAWFGGRGYMTLGPQPLGGVILLGYAMFWGVKMASRGPVSPALSERGN
ncbi:MAG: DUF2029 domain-containing protein [Phycisphaerales bacterium]|nr:DUF2029 domain-containing protein [Phycisphaerales bacterium]